MGRYQVDMANMLGLFLPGSFLAYYGDELGMINNLKGSSTNPFQWNDTKSAGAFDILNKK